MTLRLTDRDSRIMAKCALCRWLSTSQIQRLFFQQAGVNAVQKRLRKLADEGYLRSYRENPMAEVFHAVGPKARPLLEEKGIELASGSEIPKQLAHLTGINTIRLALETSGLPLAFFFAHWQLADLGWTFPVIPDAVSAIARPDPRRFLVEYDRGTEPIKTLLQKLRAYNQGIPGFSVDAVLLVTEQSRCLDRLGREVRREGIHLPCLAASLPEVAGRLMEPIFLDLSDGTTRPLLTRS